MSVSQLSYTLISDNLLTVMDRTRHQRWRTVLVMCPVRLASPLPAPVNRISLRIITTQRVDWRDAYKCRQKYTTFWSFCYCSKTFWYSEISLSKMLQNLECGHFRPAYRCHCDSEPPEFLIGNSGEFPRIHHPWNSRQEFPGIWKIFHFFWILLVQHYIVVEFSFQWTVPNIDHSAGLCSMLELPGDWGISPTAIVDPMYYTAFENFRAILGICREWNWEDLLHFGSNFEHIPHMVTVVSRSAIHSDSRCYRFERGRCFQFRFLIVSK